MDDDLGHFIMGAVLGGMIVALILFGMISCGATNYNGIQTIHVVDKYSTGGSSFSIVTCDQVYYTSDPRVFTKIVENGTYKVKFSSNPMFHYSFITELISGDIAP